MICYECGSNEHDRTCPLMAMLDAAYWVDPIDSPRRVITHTCDDPCWCQS